MAAGVPTPELEPSFKMSKMHSTHHIRNLTRLSPMDGKNLIFAVKNFPNSFAFVNADSTQS